LWDDEKGLLTFPYDNFDYAYKLDRNGSLQTIYGDRVSKTMHWREGQPGIFESDVPRETRVLTDLYLNEDQVAKGHRVLFFDIEVSSIGGFASVTKANKEITAIGCYDQHNDREVMWVWDRDGNMDGKEKQVGKCLVKPFDTEAEMLMDFLTFYTQLSPTILVGWNSNNYDIPYLYTRLSNVFDTDTANMLSPIGMVKFNQYRGRWQIAGVNCLDYFDMYQKFTYARRPSYRLDAIGMYEVNMGKVKYDGTLDTLFRDDLEKFIEYNLRDVHIVVAIDKKMKLIDLVMNISHVGHTQYDDYPYSSKYIEGTILTYLHRNGRVAPNKRAEGRAEFNERLEDDEEGFAGAFVQPPKPGLYEWVYNLDLQSLYPSIIMSLNISPETKVGYVKNWNLNQHLKSKSGKYIVAIGTIENVLDYDQFMQFMEDEKFMLSSNGVLYRSDKTGVIPEILDKWFSERIEYKKLMKKYKQEGNAELADYYDRRQHVQKILLNSIYGVLGLPIFRFYDLDNALAVTATGQDIIKTSARFISKKLIGLGAQPRTDDWLVQYKEVVMEEIKKGRLDPADVPYLMDPENLCIYIDTDSVYFTAEPFLDGSDPQQFTIDFARARESEINGFYDIMAKRMFFADKHRLVIKGEAVNSTAFWVAKKRYAMRQVYDLESSIDFSAKPKMKVKGLDVVRSSFPPAFQRIMSTVLDDILQKTPKTTVDKAILDFRSHMNGLPFEEVARNTSVKEITKLDMKREKSYNVFPKGMPAHVKASITYNRWLRNMKLDKEFEAIRDSDKIKWTYLKRNNERIETMALKGYDDPPELVKFVNEYMDYDKLYETELENKLADFYDALGWGLLPTSINQQASKFFDF
jgi:DNA polymerase elongation subunit (family B)